MIECESDDNSIDLFYEYIEYDPDKDHCEEDSADHTANKENIHEKRVDKPKKAKAKKKQFLLINAFMGVNDEKSIDKAEYGRKWLTLCDALNEAGPPKFTPQEWKNKWTSHLYNVNKRKRSSKDLTHGNKPKMFCQDKHASNRKDNTDVCRISHGQLSPSTNVEAVAFIYDQDKTSGIENTSRIGQCDSSRSIKFATISFVDDQDQPSSPANNSDIIHVESSGSTTDDNSYTPAITPFCNENLASSSIHGQHDSNSSGMLKEDFIIRGQNAIVNRLDLVIKRLDKSNDLLEELVRGKK